MLPFNVYHHLCIILCICIGCSWIIKTMIINAVNPKSVSVIGEILGADRVKGVHVPKGFTTYTNMYASVYCPVGYFKIYRSGADCPYILVVCSSVGKGFMAGELACLFNYPS